MRDHRRLVWAVVTGVAIIAVVGFLILGLANRGVSNSIETAIRAGERPEAPQFTLPVVVAGGGIGPAGSELALSSLRGKVVVVNLWASWCRPCIAESALLEALWSRYRDQGVLVLGIQSEDLSRNGPEFFTKYGLTYPSVRDGSGATKRDFQALAVPETFVVDRQGQLALVFKGELTAESAAGLSRVVGQLQREPATG